MISGGWVYIGAAYGLTWSVLVLYAASLYVRFRRIRKRERELS